MNPETIAAIERHYDHARAKHPHFCDALLPCDLPLSAAWYISRKNCEHQTEHNLNSARKRLKLLMDKKSATFERVLDCEIWEALDALMRGDTAQAREELLDAIAVLLRTIDILDGSQPITYLATAPDGAYPTLTVEAETKGAS